MEAASEDNYDNRVSASSVVHEEKIWIIAGESGFNTAAKNDVWYLNFTQN